MRTSASPIFLRTGRMSRSKPSPSWRRTTLGLDASGSPAVSVVNASWLSMASPSVLFARSVVVPRFPRCPQARNRIPTYRVIELAYPRACLLSACHCQAVVDARVRRAARRPWPRSPSTGSARALPAPGGTVNRLPFPRSTRHRRALPKFAAITLTSAQDSASETPAQHPALGQLPTPAGASAQAQRGESRLPFLGYRGRALPKGLWRTSHDRTPRNRVRSRSTFADLAYPPPLPCPTRCEPSSVSTVGKRPRVARRPKNDSGATTSSASQIPA